MKNYASLGNNLEKTTDQYDQMCSFYPPATLRAWLERDMESGAGIKREKEEGEAKDEGSEREV